MTTQEAQKWLEVAGETMCDVREHLRDAISDAQYRLAQFERMAEEYDFSALRDAGFIGRRQCADYQAALAVMHAAERES